MSRISMIILGMFIQGVCEFLAMARGFTQETMEQAKLKYFHTYNRLLIMGCVIYYYVLLLKNAEQLYSAMIACYAYGLLCLPFNQHCFEKYFSMETPK